MSFQDFMNKLRYWDNMTAKWMMRHFYFLFFQIVLLIVFFLWLANALEVISFSFQSPPQDPIERLLASQSINVTILVFLLIMNSFWLLFMFNGFLRIRSLLQDMNFNISKLRSKKDF